MPEYELRTKRNEQGLVTCVIGCECCGSEVPTKEFERHRAPLALAGAMRVMKHFARDKEAWELQKIPLCEFCATTRAGSLYNSELPQNEAEIVTLEIWKAAGAVANYLRYTKE